jgi:hypothetical protein
MMLDTATDSHTLPVIHTFLPSSVSSHSFILSSLLADLRESSMVSSLETAAKARMPFPMEETRVPSTDTEADLTRCKMTNFAGQ